MTTKKRNGDAGTDTEAALNAGEVIASLRLAGEVRHAGEGGRPYRITDADRVESLEAYLPAPVSIRAEVDLADADSFLTYVNRFATHDSAIFADKHNKRFTAVLDYHGPEAPRWGRHRAVFTLRETRQFALWRAVSGTPMTQAAFAQHLEDNIPDIAAPDGAMLVEIARTLQAKKEITFESNIMRTIDGSFKFFYQEAVQGSPARSGLVIPDVFSLVLTPFEGMEPVRIDARFRFRVGEGGKLSLWFELVRLEDVLEAAFIKTQEDIQEGLVEVVFVSGLPPRSAAE